MAKNYEDPKGRHIRVYVSLLNSVAWRVLPASARSLFIDMRATLGKTNNGDISATMATLVHKGWSSPATLAKALYELQALGFIVKTRGGGVEHGSKVCSLFAFTDVEIYAQNGGGKAIPAAPASHAYAAFKTVAEAERALKTGFQQLRQVAVDRKAAASARKKTTLQKLKRDATETEASTPVDATETEAESDSTLQKLKLTARGRNRPQTRMDAGFQPSQAGETDRAPTATETEHLCITTRGQGQLPAAPGPVPSTARGSKQRAAPSRKRAAEVAP